MGIKDNFTVLFGSGIDYAGKKAETIKLQADLTKTAASIESAYAALGRAVMREESANESFLAVYGSRVSAVRELERHAAETQARIDELSRTQGVPSAFAALPKTAPVGKCPACGASVLVDSMFCPTCGDNLAALKAAYAKCPNCGAFYDANTVFCIECGTRVEPLSVAEQRPEAAPSVQPEIPVQPVQVQMPVQLQPVQPQVPVQPQPAPVPSPPVMMVCPSCGERVDDTDSFCGGCGARLK